MTLTPDQWKRIYDGIPSTIRESTMQKERSHQYVNNPDFPIAIITIISQGIPITTRREQDSILSDDKRTKTTTYAQFCRARISVVIEDPDMMKVEALASGLATELYARELGINPLRDRMQFRGCDPPTHPPPYRSEKLKMLIHRCVLDFFVEYEFSWTLNFPVIREFEVEAPYKLQAVEDGKIFSVDCIISR